LALCSSTVCRVSAFVFWVGDLVWTWCGGHSGELMVHAARTSHRPVGLGGYCPAVWPLWIFASAIRRPQRRKRGLLPALLADRRTEAGEKPRKYIKTHTRWPSFSIRVALRALLLAERVPVVARPNWEDEYMKRWMEGCLNGDRNARLHGAEAPRTGPADGRSRADVRHNAPDRAQRVGTKQRRPSWPGRRRRWHLHRRPYPGPAVHCPMVAAIPVALPNIDPSADQDHPACPIWTPEACRTPDVSLARRSSAGSRRSGNYLIRRVSGAWS